MDYSHIFDSLPGVGKYKLIDATHPLSFFKGLTDDGFKSFVFASASKPIKLKGTKVIDVKVVKESLDGHYNIFFNLKDDEYLAIFCRLLEDIMEATRDCKDAKDATRLACLRYSTWKMFFKSKKEALLTDEEVRGLIGELLFLSSLLRGDKKTKAVASWSGCELTHKDFSIDDCWFEIKTTLSSTDSVKISSLEQLDADVPGFLMVFELEKMSPEFNGITLNGIVNHIFEIIDEPTDAEIFAEKLELVGYVSCDEYNCPVYRQVSNKLYLVDDSFPRLTRKNVMKAISKAEYSLLKSEISDYEVKSDD